MRSNTRSSRGYASARTKPALFVAFIFAAALALTGVSFHDIPTAKAVSTTIVISEFRHTGPSGGNDEFVELTNISASPVDISGWKLNGSNVSGTTGTRATIPANVILCPGEHYLLTNSGSNGYSGSVPGDQTYSTGITNDGGLAILNASNVIIDQVGMSTGSAYKEGTPLAPLTGTANQSYRRKMGGTQDTDSNADDFELINPSNPQRRKTISIADVTQAEGDAGTSTFAFTVTLSEASCGSTTFSIATADGTTNPANAGSDYVAQTLTSQSIPAGTTTYTFNVTVNGDTVVEPTETFFVNVTNVVGAAVGDGQALGTIQNDDSSDITINDVSQDEGSGGGTTAYTFTVTLSKPSAQNITVNYATANGTTNPATGGADCNTAGVDYISTNGTLTFLPNDTSEQITVQVCADAAQEPNETFFVNLSSQSANATIADAQGVGTVVNDDFNLKLISEVQGSTPSGNAPSPRLGENLTVRGIVTLLKSNGFFLQEEVSDYDSDPNTSEGIFVFTSAAPTVAVASRVTVTGTVVEFNGLTEISTSNANVITNNTGNDLSTATPPVTLTTADLPPTAHFTQPQLEKYEGMRLTAPSLTTVTHNDNFFDVPAVITGVPRPLREPGIPADNTIPPDPSTGTPDCCIPRFDLNPEQIFIDTNGRAGSTGETLTSNVVITNLIGPLDYAFGAYRIINETALTRSANMSAVPVPTPYATEFTVAGFNIENFNNNATQRQKAALGIVRVMRLPDIIGHAEIFDLASLEALATEVNSRAVADGHPNPMYEARLIPTPVAGITQNVGYLVKTSRVRIDAVTQERTASRYTRPSDNAEDETHDRPPLVLRATIDPTGVAKPVIVVVNHTRSFINIDLVAGDGPNVRAKRKAQAEDLADLFQDLQTDNPGVPVIAVGDYNAYQFNNGYDDPIAVMKGTPTADEQIVVDASPDLVNPNFLNLIDKLPASERYTFTFDETVAGSPTNYEELTAQALDHVLVNTVANNINTRIAVARMNADFPEVPAAAFASDATRPERNSDHDAPVAYFTLFAEAQAGQLLINEFRHFGPTSAQDEFIEIYNNTEVEHVVAATDGSAGYSIATAADQTAGTPRCTIPNGTRIPSRGYFLCVNSAGYSLAGYPSGTNPRNSAGDATYTSDLPVNAGIALFSTSNTANYNTDTRLDAAGSASEENTLYKEGAGYPDINSTPREYSFFRDLRAGRPQDTNGNAADFVYVNTEGAGGQLGAPGPQNLSSPTQLNQLIKASPIDPCAGVAAGANQERDQTAVTNGQHGTLTLRRTFTNKTQTPVTRLRFRVVDITTLNSPGYAPGNSQADLRVLSSTNTTLTVTGANCQGTQQIPMAPLTLEDNPPAQPLGGGLHSTLAAGTITLDAPLGAGQSRNFEFVLGVQQRGVFRFFVNVEVEPESQMTEASPAKAGERRTKR